MKKICFLLFCGLWGVLDVWAMDGREMSGWKTRNLNGKVKSVVYQDGSSLTFDRVGNVVRSVDSEKYVTVYDYINACRYILQEEFYDIEWEENVRKEVKENSKECLGTVYTFDELGRIRKYVRTDYGDLEEAEYWYQEEAELPWKTVKSEFWETGMAVQVSEIRYLETDSLGNWLQREVKYTIKEVNYEAADSVFVTRKQVESRKIVYFTTEELARYSYTKVVERPLAETKSIGLRKTTPILVKQRKELTVWQYGLVAGGICLILGIAFYCWKK